MVARLRRAEGRDGPCPAGPDPKGAPDVQAPSLRAERERRREADRERLRQAAEQLLSSEGWQRWVRTRANNGLSRYSFNNQLLIALRTGGTATFVAGFRAWLKLGYAVRKGERAIRIFAPMPLRPRGEKEESGADADSEERRVLFRSVGVFDRRQVDAFDGPFS